MLAAKPATSPCWTSHRCQACESGGVILAALLALAVGAISRLAPGQLGAHAGAAARGILRAIAAGECTRAR